MPGQKLSIHDNGFLQEAERSLSETGKLDRRLMNEVWKHLREERFTPIGKVQPPKKASVLHSLCLDAISFENNPLVEDFMEEFGYEDYRAGKKAHRACGKTFKKLREAIGGGNVYKIAELTSQY